MRTHLIGFSGPPRSGKDTIANLVADSLRHRGVPVQVLSCSTPMRMATYAILGLEYSDEHYEANKDSPIHPTAPTTIRKEMIALSENHVKSRLGKWWWCQNLAARVNLPDGGVVVVPDMGFWPEVLLFEQLYGVTQTAWFHVHREGKDFSSDSRGYVGIGHTIHNNAGLAEYAARHVVETLDRNYNWPINRTPVERNILHDT